MLQEENLYRILDDDLDSTGNVSSLGRNHPLRITMHGYMCVTQLGMDQIGTAK